MSSPPRSTASERYRLISSIGEGGMGRVWLARDEVLHRDVAVKEVVPPSGLTESEGEQAAARGLREARAIARLNHPNVVRIFDVVATSPRPWIVMEYVKSRSLQDRIAVDGPIPVAEVARIGLGILSALQAAHRAGVLHRDVKPSNVLLAEDGRVVLTDFGLATLAGDATLTRSGLILGSPAYIAPERARQGITGPESDLWSLGATLYAAVEGRAPYHRSTAMATLTALVTEPPDPALLAGPLGLVLDALLDKNPASRMAAPQAARLLRRLAGQSRQPDRQPWRAQRGSAPAAPARPGTTPAATPPAVPSITPTARLVPPAARPVPPTARPVPPDMVPAAEPATVLEPSPIVPPGGATAGSASPASGIPPQRTPDAELEPSGPRPTEPEPATSARSQPAGTGSTSIDPVSGESADTEPAGPQLTESELAGSEPAGSTPAASTLAEPTPVESGSARAESGSASVEPGDSEAAEEAPAAAPPAAQPPTQQPPTGQQATPQRATEKLPTVQPATEKLPAARPATTKPTTAMPTTAMPTTAVPTTAMPSTAKSPAAPERSARSAGGSPAAASPAGGSPVAPLVAGASAGPAGVRPAGPARKPMFAMLGIVLAIVLVSVIVVIATHHGSSGSSGSSGAALAPPSRTPSAVASGSPSAGGSPAATASPPPSVSDSAPASAPASDAAGTGGTTLPAGWQMHHDPTGFSVAVPVGWTISHSGTIVYFHDPSGGRLLGVDQTNQPKSDPVQDWTTQAQYRVSHGDFPGYQQIKIAAVPYHVKAADWEFTYNKSGTRTHVINRGAVFGPHQAYGFYWSTPDSVWSANLSNFELIMSTFQGKTD